MAKTISIICYNGYFLKNEDFNEQFCELNVDEKADKASSQKRLHCLVARTSSSCKMAVVCDRLSHSGPFWLGYHDNTDEGAFLLSGNLPNNSNGQIFGFLSPLLRHSAIH